MLDQGFRDCLTNGYLAGESDTALDLTKCRTGSLKAFFIDNKKKNCTNLLLSVGFTNVTAMDFEKNCLRQENLHHFCCLSKSFESF